MNGPFQFGENFPLTSVWCGRMHPNTNWPSSKYRRCTFLLYAGAIIFWYNCPWHTDVNRFSSIRLSCSNRVLIHSSSSISASTTMHRGGISTSAGITASVPLYQWIRGGPYWGTYCSAITQQSKRQLFMPLSRTLHHFMNYLFYIFVSIFYIPIRFSVIWSQISMFSLKLMANLLH